MQQATDLGRVVFTHDRDFLALAAVWQQTQREFTGMVCAHQLRITIGAAIHDLALIALLIRPESATRQDGTKVEP